MRTVIVDAMVVAGFVALGLVGGPLPVVASLGAVISLAAGWLPARWRKRVPWTPLAAGALLGIAGQIALGAQPVEALGSLLAVLQVHRRVARRGADDERVAVVLAGLMIVAAAGASPSLAFVAVAVVFGAGLPVALLPARAGQGRAAAEVLGWGWLPLHGALAGLVFVCLPRPVQPEVAPPAARMTGFAPDVALGELDPLLDDPSVVFRARTDDPSGLPDPIYWRGIALDGFDGQSWFSRTPPAPTTVTAGAGVDVTIELLSAVDGVLFVPGRVVGLDADPVVADAQGGWFVEPRREALTYTVTVARRGADDPWMTGDRHPRWLELPAMDSRVFELARSVAGEGEDAEQIERLAHWLRTETTYTRAGRPASDGPPLEDYLLRHRQGHCELVAAGLAVMGRAVDVPTRVVNGFVGSDLDPLTGELVVRRHHAHSWTEVWLDGAWMVVDATPEDLAPAAPPVWTPWVRSWHDAAERWLEADLMGFDRTSQRGAVVQAAATVESWVRVPTPWDLPWLGLGMLALAVVGGASLARGAWRWVLGRVSDPTATRPQGPVAREQRRARDAVAAAGLRVPTQLPPVEAAEWLRDHVSDDVYQALHALAWLHYEVALGEAAAADHGAAARGHAAVVVQGLRDHGTESP